MSAGRQIKTGAYDVMAMCHANHHQILPPTIPAAWNATPDFSAAESFVSGDATARITERKPRAILEIREASFVDAGLTSRAC